MLIEMAFVLTAVAVVLELYLVYRFRLLLELFARQPLLGLAFSLTLSWLLGESFGAAGMTVLVAAVASTIVTASVYRTGALLALDSVLQLVAK